MFEKENNPIDYEVEVESGFIMGAETGRRVDYLSANLNKSRFSDLKSAVQEVREKVAQKWQIEVAEVTAVYRVGKTSKSGEVFFIKIQDRRLLEEIKLENMRHLNKNEENFQENQKVQQYFFDGENVEKPLGDGDMSQVESMEAKADEKSVNFDVFAYVSAAKAWKMGVKTDLSHDIKVVEEGLVNKKSGEKEKQKLEKRHKQIRKNIRNIFYGLAVVTTFAIATDIYSQAKKNNRSVVAELVDRTHDLFQGKADVISFTVTSNQVVVDVRSSVFIDDINAFSDAEIQEKALGVRIDLESVAELNSEKDEFKKYISLSKVDVEKLFGISINYKEEMLSLSDLEDLTNLRAQLTDGGTRIRLEKILQ